MNHPPSWLATFSLLSLAVAWTAVADQQNPPTEFDTELNTPGVVFDLRETGRQQGRGPMSVSYEITMSGFPTDKEYEFWVLVGKGPKKPWLMCPVDASGGQFLCGKGSPLEEAKFLFGNFLRGESYGVLIISKDRSVYAFAKNVPVPIEDQDGSCRINVEAVSPKVFRAMLSGFPVGETVEVMAKIGRKILEETFVAEKSTRHDGLQKDIELRPRRGRGGHTIVDVKASSCKLSVEYWWGTKARYQ